jgi:hypothetical protein
MAKLAAAHFAGGTPVAFARQYLMQGVLAHSMVYDKMRKDAPKKRGLSRYIADSNAVEFSFRTSIDGLIISKGSEYMANLTGTESYKQRREVLFTPQLAGMGFTYCFFEELISMTGQEISRMVSAKEVTSLTPTPKNTTRINVELLDQVIVDIVQFLYTEKPTDKTLASVRMQQAA